MHKDIKDCDFDFQNDELYMEFKDELTKVLLRMTQISLADYREQIEKDELDMQQEINIKTQHLLEEIVLQEPVKKMFKEKIDEKKKKQNRDILEEGIDNDAKKKAKDMFGASVT